MKFRDIIFESEDLEQRLKELIHKKKSLVGNKFAGAKRKKISDEIREVKLKLKEK